MDNVEYYLKEHFVLMKGSFIAKKTLEGRNFDIEFHWIPLSKIDANKIYPVNAKSLLKCIDKGTQHFIFREE